MIGICENYSINYNLQANDLKNIPIIYLILIASDLYHYCFLQQTNDVIKRPALFFFAELGLLLKIVRKQVLSASTLFEFQKCFI